MSKRSSKQVKNIIIGSGPAGYTAAIYMARARLKPLMFTGSEIGGQLMYTTEIENYPGIDKGVTGPKLMMRMREQAKDFGTEINNSLITAVDFTSCPFKVWTKLPKGVKPEVYKNGLLNQVQEVIKKVKESGRPQYLAESVIIATGASARRLNVKGEKELFGRGVSVCAVCDSAFYKDKKVYVIGGGDSAMEDALALTKYTSDVTIIHRRDEFRASKVMQERVLSSDKIKVLWNSNLKEVRGKNGVEQIVVDTKGDLKEYPADGVFLAIGHIPVTSIFLDQVKLDKKGYLVTRSSNTKEGVELAQKAIEKNYLVNYPTMTSVKGVFAAGDVVDMMYKQAISASGMGCQAALDTVKWLDSNK